MKTEVKVKTELKAVEKEHAKTLERFHEYDNYEDMELLDRLAERIRTLKWVLEK